MPLGIDPPPPSEIVIVLPPVIDSADDPLRMTVPAMVPPEPPVTVSALATTEPPKLLEPPDRSREKLGARNTEPFIVFSTPNESDSVSGPSKVVAPLNEI